MSQTAVSCRQPETRSCEPAAQKKKKKKESRARGLLIVVLWLHRRWKKRAFTKSLQFSRRIALAILGTYLKHLRKRKLHSRESSQVIGPKNVQKNGLNSSGLFVLFAAFPPPPKFRNTDASCVQIPYSISTTFAHFGEKPTRAHLKNRFLLYSVSIPWITY